MPFIAEVKAKCDLCEKVYIGDISTHSSLALGDHIKKDGWKIITKKVFCSDCVSQENILG
jgi:hypothetical protein